MNIPRGKTLGEGPDDAVVGGAKSGRLGRVHDRIIDTLASIDGGTPTDKAIHATLKRARDLGSKERHLLSDAVYGVIRKKRFLEDLLARAVKSQRKKLDLYDRPIQLRWILLCHYALNGEDVATLRARDAFAVKRIPKMFDRIVAGRVPAGKKRTPTVTFGIRHSLPDWMAERLLASFGEQRADEIGLALAQRAPVTLRVNTLRASRDEIVARIQDEHGVAVTNTENSDAGLVVEGRPSVESWPMYKEGLIEVQDEGSQQIVWALGAQPGENVLDACAGAGGKTLALAAAMKGTGRIVALDVETKKLEVLKKRARRAEVTNVEAVTADMVVLPSKYHGWADRVLVDAPCSGTGRFRRQPGARWTMTGKRMASFPSLQFGLLKRAVDAVRPGGVIVYATCSVLEEENEAVVKRLLDEDDRVERCPLEEGVAHELRIGPGPTDAGPDGFYLAKLTRRV